MESIGWLGLVWTFKRLVVAFVASGAVMSASAYIPIKSSLVLTSDNRTIPILTNVSTPGDRVTRVARLLGG